MTFPGLGNGAAVREMAAISGSQAIAKFDLAGVVLDANANFCNIFDYDASELVGRRHSMLMPVEDASSGEYMDIWEALRAGRPVHRLARRTARHGRTIWIDSHYDPVMKNGRPVMIIEIATDVTSARRQTLEQADRFEAVARAQAVVEFTPQGIVLDANSNFRRALGYRLDEIVGKHHSMFCYGNYARGEDRGTFWQRLADGECLTGEYVRRDKNGRPVWLNATYSPILDDNGAVIRVMKVATDVTEGVASVERLGQAIMAVAGGNLAVNLDEPVSPDLERTRADLSTAIERLRSMLKTIFDTATAISADAGRLQAATGRIGERIEQHASSIEDTAATLDEMTADATDAAIDAAKASYLVSEARSTAEKSAGIVRSAMEAMGGIEDSAKRIGAIGREINEIACETSFLAISAAIEATHSGESADGFAAVAQEFRALAQRSADAAREIRALAGAPSSQIALGVALVNETASALGSFVSQATWIDGKVAAITETARLQAAGLKDVNAAVQRIDQAMQRNAEMVGQSHMASDALVDGMSRLIDQLRRFRVDVDDSRRPTPPPHGRTPHLTLVSG